MKSPEETISDDAPRRPVLATGLPAHRARARQVLPLSARPFWRRRGIQFTGFALAAAVVLLVFLNVSGARQGDGIQPGAIVEPGVVQDEDAPETAAPTSVPEQPAEVAPVLAAEPVNTPTLVAVLPTAAPSTLTPVPATATPVRQATGTPLPASSDVQVGNTDGTGVYVRRTPSVEDRVRAYEDGTRLTIIGEDVVADGQQWKHVRTPDGLEGYVPGAYVTKAGP